MKIISLSLALLVAMMSVSVRAYPPAPHHTIYGMVRDQFGVPLQVLPNDVYLVTPSGTELRGSLVGDLGPGINYRLEVPMDSGTAADVYQPTALRPYFLFKLKVKIGQITYLPIQMAGNFAQIGQPGQETRIDLTLGVDSDGDGLPDAWEQALIAIYGGTLASINPNDDLDGDGISNLNEYLAGTYAFDPEEGFQLKLTSMTADTAEMEFLVIRGRTYSILASSNLQTWTPVSLRVVTGGVPGALQSNYKATDVRMIKVQAPNQSGANRYFKALVQ